MSKPVAFILLAVGAVLLIVGINAANSVTSESSTALTGTPTDQAMWFMIGGGAAALIGLIGVIGKSRTRHTS